MKRRTWLAAGLLLLAVCSAVSCAGGRADSTTAGGGEGLITLRGAGASFPFPLYDRWFKEYGQAHPDVRVNYQPVGSGAGVNQFTDKLVDFGASDAAMSDEEIAKVEAGVQLLPLTAGAIVLAYNLPDFQGELKLSRAAYAGIFTGKVTQWNDPLIADANPGVTLPDSPLNVIVRSDSSGTTYVFTNHLAAISPDWTWGASKNPDWPGKTLGGTGNDGVAATLARTPGSIGYVEYGYARQSGLPTALLENASGRFIACMTETMQAALARAEMPEDLRVWMPDPQGEQAYPIVTYSWLLCYKRYEKPAKAEALKKVIEYCLTEGQKVSEQMGYVPLPESVVAKVQKAAAKIE